MLISSKVSFCGDLSPWKIPKFGQNNFVTQISSLHCEFQLFMLNSLKVSFFFEGERGILGISPPSPPEDPQIWSKYLSHKHLPPVWVSTLYVEQFKSFILGEAILGVRPPEGSQIIVSHTTLPTFWVSTFSVEQFKSIIFEGPFGRVRFPPKDSKFDQSNCLISNFLHCEFQLFILSRSKWPFFGPYFKESPLTWSFIKTTCKQPSPHRSPFSPTLRFLH